MRGIVTNVTKTMIQPKTVLCKPSIFTSVALRQASNQTRTTITRRAARSKTVKEIITAPAGEKAFNIGKGALLGASGLGLGALCFYGLGLSSEPGAIDRSMVWPQYVKDRIHSTYMYFGGSLIITAASAVSCFRSPAIMRVVASNSLMAFVGTIAAMIGSQVLLKSIPYKEGLGAKQAAWALHAAVVGAVIAPMCFLGGPLLMRAALYTAGVVGGLSTVAVCAPSEKFLNMGGPLAIGFGVVFAASLGSMFMPPTTAFGAGLYSVALYGGLILFSAFLLYDTQRIIRAAETHSPYAVKPYDPVNASISVYLNTMNIFIRIATILAGGGNKRR